MGRDSKIEWTDSTWNPWIGCTKISSGCQNCYAEAIENRFGGNFSIVRRTSHQTFLAPIKWSSKALKTGVNQRVFVASMSDFFHKDSDQWREEAWEVIKKTPNLTYQVLTKRPERALQWYRTHGWLDNVWIGTSVENQTFTSRLDSIAHIPAKVRFASCEPLLGPLDLTKWVREHLIDWVIVGGESGPHARPMHTDWALSIRDQCVRYNIPFFFKQYGEWTANLFDVQDDKVVANALSGNVEQHTLWDGAVSHTLYRVGKKNAGRLLMGREWNEMPS